MNRSKQIIGIVVLLIACLIPLSIYLVTKGKTNHLAKQEYVVKDKQYKINDYSTVAISHEKLGQIYYTEYLNLLRFNREQAYQLLTANQKENVIPNFDSFIEEIDQKNYSSIIKNVVVINHDKTYIYTVYDEKGNKLTFTATAVMDYEVALN